MSLYTQLAKDWHRSVTSSLLNRFLERGTNDLTHPDLPTPLKASTYQSLPHYVIRRATGSRIRPPLEKQ